MELVERIRLGDTDPSPDLRFNVFECDVEHDLARFLHATELGRASRRIWSRG
jgi:hypothetical protein